MKRLRPLLIFGTRPEAIKMAPVVHQCARKNGEIEPIVCLTGQHRQMLDQVTEYFGLRADLDLELMQPNQSLATLTSRAIERIDETIQRTTPDCVVAQGDTTSVLAAATAAFYRRVPFVHVEAGLRTGDLNAPWPEEFNRRVASIVTALHCCPTEQSAENLRREGVDENSIRVTGNTVIDALLWARERERREDRPWKQKYAMLGDRRMALVTGHRRESFGAGFEAICAALQQLAEKFKAVEFVYPVHLNPNVREPVNRLLGKLPNVRLVEPVPYPEFVWLMDRCHLVLTDSGGVQEEAPSLRKPVLVMRTTTERPEAVAAGAAELVGTNVEKIVETVSLLLNDPKAYARRQIETNPYGDGRAAARIVELMLKQGWHA